MPKVRKASLPRTNTDPLSNLSPEQAARLPVSDAPLDVQNAVDRELDAEEADFIAQLREQLLYVDEVQDTE